MAIKSSQSHKLYLLCSLAVILCAATIYVYVYNEIGVYEYEASIDKDKLTVLESRSGRDGLLKDVYSNSIEARTNLRSLFVSADKVVDFIKSLEKIGSQSGAKVTISGVVSKEATIDSVGSIGAHIESIGSWQTVMYSLALAETLPYSVSIRSVSLIESIGDKTHSWRLTFDIKVPTRIVSTTS